MTAYRCRNCNYRFDSQIDRTGKSCPYCGKNSIIEEPNVDQLLMEE
ncbi:hypothetical protein HY212_06940 [Candidatus Pacearchaeota archaeon]|nr:hypothetical protein [Candidatus Pacearchaeota archaeon]